MDYDSAIKRNDLGSLVVMWMDLESVTQNEVCQKEKNKYQILTHTCGVEKSSTDGHICRTGNLGLSASSSSKWDYSQHINH